MRREAHIPKLWELQPSYKHDQVLSHRPSGYSLGGALCFVSVIKAIGFRVSSLCLSLSNTHGHLDPEILLLAAERSGRWGWRKCLPGLALHCWGSLCHSSVAQKSSSSACVTMAFRSLEHNDCWLTWMHSILIEPELIWSYLGFFLGVGKEICQ